MEPPSRVPSVSIQDPSNYDRPDLVLTNYPFMSSPQRLTKMEVFSTSDLERNVLRRVEAINAFSHLRSIRAKADFVDRFIQDIVFDRCDEWYAREDDICFLAVYLSIAALNKTQFLRKFRDFEAFVFYRRMLVSMKINKTSEAEGILPTSYATFETPVSKDLIKVLMTKECMASPAYQNTEFLCPGESYNADPNMFRYGPSICFEWTNAESLVARGKAFLFYGDAYAHTSWWPMVEMYTTFKVGWGLWRAAVDKIDLNLARTLALSRMDADELASAPSDLGLNNPSFRSALASCCKYITASIPSRYVISGTTTASVKIYPPCIKSIMRTLKTNGDLSYDRRCALFRFLRDIGVQSEETEALVEAHYKNRDNRAKRRKSIQDFYAEANPRQTTCSYMKSHGMCTMSYAVDIPNIKRDYGLDDATANTLVQIHPRSTTDEFYGNRRCSHLSHLKGNRRTSLIFTPAQMTLNTEYAKMKRDGDAVVEYTETGL